MQVLSDLVLDPRCVMQLVEQIEFLWVVDLLQRLLHLFDVVVYVYATVLFVVLVILIINKLVAPLIYH